MIFQIELGIFLVITGVNHQERIGAILNKFGNLKAVIWDMDGVIVDSGPHHFQSWHSTLEEYSLTVTGTQLRRMFGMTSPEVVRVLFGSDVKEEFVTQLVEEKEVLFRAAIKENAAYLPGVEYWLDAFQQAGISQAIASSGSQENIDAVLDALSTRRFLNEVVSGKNLPSKPDPAVFLQAARQLGINPEACLVIEDAIAGVAGAKAAGMKCLAVTTTNPPQELAGADVILQNLEFLSDNTLALLFP
jgi:beta-phosphoglucomutase